MKNFRSYQLAKCLYKACQAQALKGEARDQLIRASLSVCLNLVEGSAKPSAKERRRFYTMALASMREVQALIDLHELNLAQAGDILGAHIYRLVQATI